MILGFAQIFLVVFVLGFLVLYIFYLINLRDLLREVSPINRKMEPNNVFLILIPIFGYVYGFIMYPNIAKSVEAEYLDRGIDEDLTPFKNLGISLPIINLSGIVVRQITAMIGGLFSLVWIVLWIIFWVKSAEKKNRLRQTSGGHKLSDNDLLD